MLDYTESSSTSAATFSMKYSWALLTYGSMSGSIPLLFTVEVNNAHGVDALGAYDPVTTTKTLPNSWKFEVLFSGECCYYSLGVTMNVPD